MLFGLRICKLISPTALSTVSAIFAVQLIGYPSFSDILPTIHFTGDLCKCCVYGCSSNYKSKIKDYAYVTMYRFPFKSEDLELWIKKLPNSKFGV